MTYSNALAVTLAFTVSISFGYFITASLLPVRLGWLRLALAPGAGAGVSSFIFFLFRRPVRTVELGLLAVMIFLLWRCRWRMDLRGLNITRRADALLGLVVPGLAFAVVAFVVRMNRMPHGNWDGWAIWNWEARLLYRAGPHWRDFLPFAYHGDYPLLVPSMTARFWRYAGIEVPETGAWLGVVLALCSVAVLALTLSELRDSRLGALISLVLLGTPFYLDHATSQYADVPLSFYFLATIALIALHFEREPDRMRMLALAGFFAGCAGWTKNEGLLFIVGACIALLLPVFRQSSQTLRRFGAFCAGLAVPLGVIVFFKQTIKVQNYAIQYQQHTLQKIFDLDRHATIMRYLGEFIYSFGAWSVSPFIPLLALIIFTGVDLRVFRNAAWLTGIFIIAAVYAGYYFFYLTTPIELRVQLASSLDRLLMQFWPSVLLMGGLLCQRTLRGSDGFSE